MALVQVSVLTKNTNTHVKTYLFNTTKIVDFYANSGNTEITFYYKDSEGRREKTDKYTTSLSKSEFEALFVEALVVTRMDLPILEIYSPAKRTVDKSINVAVADIAKAWDIDSTTSYLEFNRSNFETIKVKVDATIAEIETATSTSDSLPV